MQGPSENQAGCGIPGRHAIVHAERDCEFTHPRRAIGVALDAHQVCLSPAFERVSEREVHMPMIAAAPDLVDPERRSNRPPFDIGVAAPGFLERGGCQTLGAMIRNGQRIRLTGEESAFFDGLVQEHVSPRSVVDYNAWIDHAICDLSEMDAEERLFRRALQRMKIEE